MSVLRRLRHDQGGVTMIELIVVMSVATIVLLGVFQAYDAFSSESARSSKRADVEDTLRREMGVFVGALREAPPVNLAAPAGAISPIAIARNNDIVFRDPDTTNGWLRYCIGPSTGGAGTALWRGRLVSPSVVDPGAACNGAAAGGWTYGAVIARDVTDTAGAMRYDSCPSPATTTCTASAVRSVTLNLAVQFSPGRTIRLSSSVSPRNRA